MSDSIEKKIDRILFYLESDESTGHIGVIEQQTINTKDIQEIKTNEKVRMGKIGVIGAVFGFIGANFGTILRILKSVF